MILNINLNKLKMDCKNINLEELIKKSKRADELEKELEELHLNRRKTDNAFVEQADIVRQFISKFDLSGVGLRRPWGRTNWAEPFCEDLQEILDLLKDENHQSFKLAEERRQNNYKFQEEMKIFEKEMEYKRQELVEAWENFRAIKTKRYAEVLKEIKDENI